MKLTKRQDAFIKNLLDLYMEAKEPIHYTVLAERLGVSRFTAYDMLRVLEDKGFVRSEYRLSDKAKTGRSESIRTQSRSTVNLSEQHLSFSFLKARYISKIP